jgi:S-DNA-T family DNA segregation ATPase FtsK/SpoIIIE
LSKKQDCQNGYGVWQLRLREAWLLLCFGLAIFVLLALCSYNHADPAWSHYSSDTRIIHNLGGFLGAWIASVCLTIFGYLSFVLPILIIYAASASYWQLRHSSLEHIGGWNMALLSIGFIMTAIGGCGLLTLFLPSHLNVSAGGLLGSAISANLIWLLNYYGSVLLLSLFLLIGLSFATRLSWMSLFELFGSLTLRLLRLVYESIFDIPFKSPGKFFSRNVAAIYSWCITKYRNHQIARAQDEAGAEAKLKIKALRQEPQLQQTVAKEQPVIKFTNSATTISNAERVVPSLSAADVSGTERIVPSLSSADITTVVPQLSSATMIQSRSMAPVSTVSSVDNTNKAVKSSVYNKAESVNYNFDLPSTDLLDRSIVKTKQQFSQEFLSQQSAKVESCLADFGVACKVVGVLPGPVVTRYEISLAPGTKVSKISGLAKDLARSLSVISVRVVEVIPGTSSIGLELPNDTREMVHMREVLEADAYKHSNARLAMVLGKDIAGSAVVVDLAKMPHLLVAGTTGSGKSVGLNVMLLGLLYKYPPQELRLIMIDPKMLEFSIYDEIPHLLTPVVTDMRDAGQALRWCVMEMERRYTLMSALGVRNLVGCNEKITAAKEAGQPLLNPLLPEGRQEELEILPRIVLLADEYADMMAVVGKKIETLIARLAQKARAAGIHIILATQRPSVDVITGLIKANIPTRIAFQVSSKIDSRTILDQQGADQLLGHGDMLYLPPGSGVPIRVHGAFVSDDEVHRVVAYLKSCSKPNYLEDIVSDCEAMVPGVPSGAMDAVDNAEKDDLYDEAVYFITKSRRASVSSVQRRFKIGYNRAARIVEAMEAAGVVSAATATGQRDVLAPPPPSED